MNIWSEEVTHAGSIGEAPHRNGMDSFDLGQVVNTLSGMEALVFAGEN